MIKTSPFFHLLILVTIQFLTHKTIAAIAKQEQVIVAIIDTGADIRHPTIKDHLWQNPGELGFDLHGNNRSNNGIDDDGNGYVDDVNGWNFAEQNKTIQDIHGHGTHISGLITEGQGIKIMILKAFSPTLSGEQAITATVKAIQYAVKMKANIINYSGGGIQRSRKEESAIKLAEKNKILFVAAAGNEKCNSDFTHFYPANYNFKNIISVAAVDMMGALLPSSNYGIKTVHLAAPGFHILSTLPANQFGAMTGTSQATALVTRTAALFYYQQKKSKRDPSSVIQKIISSGDRVPALQGKLKYPIVLNTLKALQANVGQ